MACCVVVFSTGLHFFLCRPVICGLYIEPSCVGCFSCFAFFWSYSFARNRTVRRIVRLRVYVPIIVVLFKLYQ